MCLLDDVLLIESVIFVLARVLDRASMGEFDNDGEQCCSALPKYFWRPSQKSKASCSTLRGRGLYIHAGLRAWWLNVMTIEFISLCSSSCGPSCDQLENKR